MCMKHCKTESWKQFNHIATRYDVINTVLSGGLHRWWRRCLFKQLPDHAALEVLDLATGTGDVMLTLSRYINDTKPLSLVGLDMSEGMLACGRQKAARCQSTSPITFVHGDACHIPYPDASFNLVTMSFGIRNVPNVSQCLQECYRVLKPSGVVLILEFSFFKQVVS